MYFITQMLKFCLRFYDLEKNLTIFDFSMEGKGFGDNKYPPVKRRVFQFRA